MSTRFTRWKWRKEKGIKGYKLWYAGLDGRRNWIGILVSNDNLKQLVEVRRCNDKIMLVRIVVGGRDYIHCQCVRAPSWAR